MATRGVVWAEMNKVAGETRNRGGNFQRGIHQSSVGRPTNASVEALNRLLNWINLHVHTKNGFSTKRKLTTARATPVYVTKSSKNSYTGGRNLVLVCPRAAPLPNHYFQVFYCPKSSWCFLGFLLSQRNFTFTCTSTGIRVHVQLAVRNKGFHTSTAQRFRSCVHSKVQNTRQKCTNFSVSWIKQRTFSHRQSPSYCPHLNETNSPPKSLLLRHKSGSHTDRREEVSADFFCSQKSKTTKPVLHWHKIHKKLCSLSVWFCAQTQICAQYVHGEERCPSGTSGKLWLSIDQLLFAKSEPLKTFTWKRKAIVCCLRTRRDWSKTELEKSDSSSPAAWAGNVCSRIRDWAKEQKRQARIVRAFTSRFLKSFHVTQYFQMESFGV